VIAYQPQVDDWQNFTDIKWRAAFQLTPSGGNQIVGAASFEAGANRFDVDGLWQTECGPGVQPVYRIVWRNSSRIEPHGPMGTIVRLSRKQIRHDTALFNGEWNGGFGPGVARWERLRVIQRVWKHVRGEKLEWRHVRKTRRECVPKHRFWMAEIQWEGRLD
jgi:hypothetical protein